jgi:hypothetical protein
VKGSEPVIAVNGGEIHRTLGRPLPSVECRFLSHYFLKPTLLPGTAGRLPRPNFSYVLPLQSPTGEQLDNPHARGATANGTLPARISKEWRWRHEEWCSRSGL